MSDEFPYTVIFQEYTEAPDGGGGYKKEWIDFRTTEAFATYLSGTERYQAMQQTNPVNIRIYYPYQTGITPDMRAIWVDRDKTLQLQSKPIDQGGQGEIMMLECLLK